MMASRLAEADKRLLFSPLVFEEMLDHSDKDFVAKQLHDVGNFALEFYKRFAWTEMPEDIFDLEAKSQILTTPIAAPDQAKRFVDYLLDKDGIKKIAADYGPDAKQWKSERLENDKLLDQKAKRLAEAGSAALKRENLIKFVETYPMRPVLSPSQLAISSNELIRSCMKILA